MDIEAPLPGALGRKWADLSSARLQELLTETNWALPVRPSSTITTATKATLLESARQQLSKPWPRPLGSALIRYHTDGARKPYEDEVLLLQNRLTVMTIAALIDGSPRWIDQVIDGAVALCEQLSWCWPAHDEFAKQSEHYVPDPDRPFLDLGAGEVAVQLAWVVRLLGERLDRACPGLTDLIRGEIQRRVFIPFLEREDWHWLGTFRPAHNWCAWIHGNLLTATLALGPSTPRADEVLWKALQGLARYLEVLPSDGAIDEGFSYWWNGVARALEALDYLSLATGGELEAVPQISSLSECVAFPWRMRLGDDLYVSFSDAMARPHEFLPWDTLWRAAGECEQGESEAWALAQFRRHNLILRTELGLSRTWRTLSDDFLWRAIAGPEIRSPYASSVWLPSLEFTLGRTGTTTPTGFTMTLKGGHNDENHNHNDVGTFTLTLNGEPLIVDPGRVEYTAQTFSERRYEIWAMRSRAHSVPIIANLEQSTGSQFRARGAVFSDDDNQVRAALDIAGAYPIDGGSWVRTVTLDRPGERVTLEDRWQGISGPHEQVLIVAAPVTQLDQHTLLLGSNTEHRCLMRAEGAGFILAEQQLTDPLMVDSWGESLTRISWVTTGGNNGSSTVTFSIA